MRHDEVVQYPTAAGLTFEVSGVFVNAPFDQPGCDRSPVRFERDGDGFAICHGAQRFDVTRVMPLPGYIGAELPSGTRVTRRHRRNSPA